MAERPPELRRYRRSAAPRRASALTGLLIGLGILAVIVWTVSARGGGDGGTETQPEAAAAPEGSASTPVKPTLRIVFPEGFTRKQMAERVREVNRIAKERRNITPALSPRVYARAADSKRVPAGFERSNAPHLEGFLFPATYEFTEDTTAEELVRMQLAAFGRAWGQIDLKYARSKNLTPYDVLIIASMVEKEVQVPKERPLVAAVIYNRLRLGFPLGIDATIRYGLDIPPTQAILQSQLDSDNPYNTRKFQGLTPTPIANPGLASIQAAAHPAEVDYLYFIRKEDCRSHFFTASAEEFENYPRAGLRC